MLSRRARPKRLHSQLNLTQRKVSVEGRGVEDKMKLIHTSQTPRRLKAPPTIYCGRVAGGTYVLFH